MNFQNIKTSPTGPKDSFEDLACILFRKFAKKIGAAEYARIRGAGGDGGVEAIFIESSGHKLGVQAKYFFKLEPSQFGQIKESLKTAITNHPTLREYHIYVPFDLTNTVAGGKRGTSEREKFDSWKNQVETERFAKGCPLKIILLTAADIRQQIFELDGDGGLRRYWFAQDVLTEETVRRGLAISEAKAGPRFTSSLDVVTDAYKLLDIFGGTSDIGDLLKDEYVPLVRSLIHELPSNSEKPYACLGADEERLVAKVDELVESLELIRVHPEDSGLTSAAIAAIRFVLPLMAQAEKLQLEQLQVAHGEHADSVGFRQFQAEYMVAFPAGDLDSTRKTIDLLNEILEFLDSAKFRVIGSNTLLMIGPAGIGKTHSLVSAAKRRLERHALSAVLFGDDFDGKEPWKVLADQLGVGTGVGRDELYGTMEAAADHTGFPFLIVIDALNESPNLQKWKTQLRALIAELKPFKNIRLIVSTRDTYLSLVVDTEFPGYAFRNTGFVGKEIVALQAFCERYKITAEITPIFSDELTNPLFLQLACKTLHASGTPRLDLSLPGFVTLIENYFRLCNDEVRAKLGYSNPANLVRIALTKIVESCQERNTQTLTWDEANAVIRPSLDSEVKSQDLLEGLRQAGLIIVVPSGDESHQEYSVRIGFQKFSDVLIAVAVAESAATGGALNGTTLSSAINKFEESDLGILEALACVLPQRFDVELPLLETKFADAQIMDAFVKSLPWRSRAGLSRETDWLVLAALNFSGLWESVYPTLFKISLIPEHRLNGNYLHSFLISDSITHRDPYLSRFASESFKETGVIYSILECVQSASIERFPSSSLELLATVLAWLTSASDRRVRDRAIKGLTRLIAHAPYLAAPLLGRMEKCQDGYIYEGLVLAIYGARLLSRDDAFVVHFLGALKLLVEPAYDTANILIRDCVQLLAKSLPVDSVPDLSAALALYPRPVALPSSWPTLKDVDDFLNNDQVPPNLKMRPTGMYTDFSQYQVRGLVERFDLKAAGISYENILAWFMLELVKIRYAQTRNVLAHDHMIRREFGDGRSKPVHAETLGKKYYWIALHRLIGILKDNVPLGLDYDDSPKLVTYLSQDLRKIDPTDLRMHGKEITYDMSLLGDSRYPFDAQPEDDNIWVRRPGDITPLPECALRSDTTGTEWVLLNFYSGVSEEEEGIRDSRDGYRRVVFSLGSVFIARDEPNPSKADADTLSRPFQTQGHEYRGFLGEYPRSDFYVAREAEGDFSSTYTAYGKDEKDYGLTTLDLLRGGEWEYDCSSAAEIRSLRVPAPEIVKVCNLTWDGHSGWLDSNGQLVGVSLANDERSGFYIRRSILDEYLAVTRQSMIFRYWIWRLRINRFADGGAQSDNWVYARYDNDLSPLFSGSKVYPE